VRNKILRDLAEEKKLEFMRSLIGQSVEAITLRTAVAAPDGDFTEALTDNYQKLQLQGRHKPNRWITANIQGVEDGALVGELQPIENLFQRKRVEL
jgi:tRNA A37 methylthiotransferase MiaB